MSAFVVGTPHLDAILGWCNRAGQYGTRINWTIGGRSYRADQIEDLTAIGGLLLNTNQEAVNTRYGEHDVAPAYVFRFPARHLKAVEVLKALNCYDYQACELADYEHSDAAAIIDRIRREAIRALPGYDAAAWEISEAC